MNEKPHNGKAVGLVLGFKKIHKYTKQYWYIYLFPLSKQLFLIRSNISQPVLIKRRQVDKQQQYGVGSGRVGLQEVSDCEREGDVELVGLLQHGHHVVDHPRHVDDGQQVPVVRRVLDTLLFWWWLKLEFTNW